MNTTPERLTLELAYQRERVRRSAEVGPTPRYILERYARAQHWRRFSKEFLFRALGDIRHKRILDFGCGEGELTSQFAALGACVTGVDISPELIAVARRRVELDGVSQRVEFRISDVTKEPLPAEEFDCIVCSRVLHHVDLRPAVLALYPALKRGGQAILIEPIAFSTALQRLRDRVPVPKDASPGERQLNPKDIEFIRSVFPHSQVVFFDLFGRLTRLLPNRNRIDRGHPFTKAASLALTGVDRLLLDLFPSLSKYAGTVVVVGRKPVAA